MIKASETSLKEYLKYQLDIYEKVKHDFLNVFASVNKDSDHILPFWKNINSSLLKKFTPYPPFNFLDTKEIAETMYSYNEDGARNQLQYLKELYDDEDLLELLQEQLVGDPLILDEKYLASCNSIHHFYHYQRYFNKVSDKTETIVEFGAGYGHLAYMLHIIGKTYVIIDTPLMNAIQWLYLTCCGEKVNVVKNDQPIEIKDGYINLIPIHRLEEININADLFIALWSLSEAADKTQDFMEKTNFLNSKHLMLAFHSNVDSVLPNGNRLYNFTKDKYLLESTGNVEGHFYCFN